jgi:peptide/nickel transport system permease protein
VTSSTRFPGGKGDLTVSVGVNVPEPPRGRSSGRWSRSVHVQTFMENRAAVTGLAVLLLIALFSFIGPLTYHTSQSVGNLEAVNLSPSSSHLLGTDDNGFDILGRLMAGGQISIEIGLAVALIATTFGMCIGAISGYFGKAVDATVMRVVDIGLAVPPVFIFIFLSLVFKPSVGLLILILAGVSWLAPARLVRGETLSLRTQQYVEAARILGSREEHIIRRHIVPNAMGTVIVNATFQVADAIVVLALLNYLGFSLPPPTATWGGMLSDGTQFLADGYWWQIYPALAAIAITVVALNLVGDGLRDAFDARLARR